MEWAQLIEAASIVDIDGQGAGLKVGKSDNCSYQIVRFVNLQFSASLNLFSAPDRYWVGSWVRLGPG